MQLLFHQKQFSFYSEFQFLSYLVNFELADFEFSDFEIAFFQQTTSFQQIADSEISYFVLD